jgi:hypothetical protein
VSVGRAFRRDSIEARPPILELHTLPQTRERGLIGLMPYAHQIFALDFG